MSATEVLVPDIGDFKNVDVIEVLVAVGDNIALDDPVLTLETDKASMEVPSSAAGVVKEVKVKVGDKVSQGSPMLVLEAEAGANADQKPAQTKEPEATTAETKTPETQEPETKAAQKAAPQATSQPAKDQPTAASASPVRPGGPIYASPAVRRIAREHQIDLTQIAATGAKGRITREDIESFIQGGGAKSAAAAPQGAKGIEPIPMQDFSKFGQVETISLSRIKKISAAHLHRVWVNVPHVTYHEDIDITELEAFRKSLQKDAEQAGVKLTPLIFIMQALAKTLRKFPNFNASLGAEPGTLILKKYYHIGIAVDTPDGLVVPVVRDVDQKGVFELAEELADISARARDGKLTAADMSGGCMTISSLGGIGGKSFTPIINAPEIAILGVTRSSMQPVWNGSEFVPRLLLPLDLSFDHRALDGAEAARFVAYLGSLLTDFRRMLL